MLWWKFAYGERILVDITALANVTGIQHEQVLEELEVLRGRLAAAAALSFTQLAIVVVYLIITGVQYIKKCVESPELLHWKLICKKWNPSCRKGKLKGGLRQPKLKGHLRLPKNKTSPKCHQATFQRLQNRSLPIVWTPCSGLTPRRSPERR